MPKIIEIAPGTKFKYWTVIKEAGTCTKFRQKQFLCECKCGIQKVLYSANLRTNLACFMCFECTKEIQREKSTKHGAYGTRAYNVWRSMNSRCFNMNDNAYHNYGGRGIRVCGEWLLFENFLKDMGQPPMKHQLDRINPDGDYELSNCRWVTSKENNNNRRNSVKYRGEYIYIKRSSLCEECCSKLK